MAALSYTDGELQFPSLSLVLPPLPVKSYDPETGKLALSLQGHTAISSKLVALQSLMLHKCAAAARTWFPAERERTQEEIAAMFQPLVSHGCLHLYCPPSPVSSFNEVKFYTGGSWVSGKGSSTIFSSGKLVRIAVRLQGISFHQHPMSKMWTGKSRVQHRILSVYTD